MDKKIKLITHTDLDGIGCYIVTKHMLLLTPEEIDVSFTANDKVDEVVNETLDNIDNYICVFITDLSVNVETATRISEMYNDGILHDDRFVVLVDHHLTATWLDDFDKKNDWTTVKVDETIIDGNVHKVCGTYLLYEYLEAMTGIKETNKSFLEFVELVRQYDTWEWDSNNNIKPKQLNDLFKIKNRFEFIEDILSNICEGLPLLSATDQLVVNLRQKDEDQYIRIKEKQLMPYKLDELSLGVVFADSYLSILGNQLNKLYPEYDAIVMLTGTTVSIRTIHDHIDVSKIAERFGGGGHKPAAGYHIKEEIIDKYIKNALGIK